ncbi:MAG TPA: S-adenosylmethionine decarboxylase [Polyangia bacterium]|nr:S-adenosylmethionine decarboxylase [Polyangia bacterium]
MSGAGIEWLVDAYDCRPDPLADLSTLRQLTERIAAELDLRVLDQRWHKFPPPGGVTGLLLLTESHLTCHTYPETGLATFNLYCCRERPDWPWARRLGDLLGAARVLVRRQLRGQREQP